MKRLLAMGIAAAVAMVVAGPASARTERLGSELLASTAAVPSGFLTRQGTQLLLDGKAWRFTGLNIYNANSDGWCGAQLNSGSRLDDALAAIGPGKEVIRSWFFQPLAINKATHERDWSGFDHALQVAGARGMKVIATLTDQWGECGSDVAGNGYKTADWYVDGYKQVQPGMLVSYRDWVAEVIGRYKDDPRIAFWQLINEAEVTPCPPGDLQPYQTLHDWATDVSGLVKSIDANHLVSLGTIGSGQCGSDGPRYKDLHAIPTIDLCEFHDYGSPTVGVPGDQYNGLQVRIDQCNALNKPIFIGEAGIIPNDVGGTLQARADAFQAKIEAQFAAGVRGFLAWAWSPQEPPISTLDNYDIGPSDPALEALRNPPLIVQIATGGQHTCALTSDGAVWCWGGNDHGELGDGTQVDRLNPVQASGLGSGVQAVSAGANHACAVTGTGGVKCWGYNGFGQLGDGTHSDRLTPMPVPGLSTGVQAIATGTYHTCALLETGGVQCWGAASRGQLGYGDTSPPWFTAIESPTPVAGLSSGARALTAGGNHTCALMDAGGAKCWGSNDFGELGDGTSTDRNSPADVTSLPPGVDAFTLGEQHACALVSGGAMCWGRNTQGQLGDGTTLSRPTPGDVTGLTTGVVAIVAGTQHTCAVTDVGGAKCWGRNESGQLGDGSTTQRPEPVDVFGLTSGVGAIAGATLHTCAIVGSGSVKCWGRNFSGELGDGTTTERDAPANVVWSPSASVPDAPTNVSATAGNGSATVSWSPPTSDGGSPITGYEITISPGGQTVSVGPSSLQKAIMGLTNCTAYTFTVRAINAVGPSEPSDASNEVRPRTTRTVAVEDTRYNPQVVAIQTEQCAEVTFTFAPGKANRRAHSVTEFNLLGPGATPLFNSGLVSPGGNPFVHIFIGATAYTYRSTGKNDVYTGAVRTPVIVSPSSGSTSTSFTIRWAPDPLPNFVFDLQYRFISSGGKLSNWTDWLQDQSGAKGTFVPTPSRGPGKYEFRARIQNALTGKQGGYSLFDESPKFNCVCTILVT
jgi:alpha-tubulin suppressor-like RCC1 family protein